MLVERVRGQVSYKKVEFLLLSLIVWSMNLYNTTHCSEKRKRKKIYGSTPKDSTPHHHKYSKTHIAAAIAPHSMGCICRCDTTKARCFTPNRMRCKVRLVTTPTRPDSDSNLSGGCNQPYANACFHYATDLELGEYVRRHFIKARAPNSISLTFIL